MLTWDQAQQMLDVHRFARDHHQTPGAAGAYDRLLKAMVDHAWSGRRAVTHPTIAEVQEQRQAGFMRNAALAGVARHMGKMMRPAPMYFCR